MLHPFTQMIASLMVHDVDEHALIATIKAQEKAHPFSSPLPAIVANGAAIFKDPNTRPEIIALLTKLTTKHPVATLPPAPVPATPDALKADPAALQA